MTTTTTTATNPALLVLLDLQDNYERFERMFQQQQLLHRFTNKNQCLSYISARFTNNRLLHFFLPKSEHTEIGANIVSLNTIYYIYCMNEQDIQQMSEQYRMPMFVKILHAESLLSFLQRAAIDHFMEEADRVRHEPDERDIALHTAAELAEALANELADHMRDKLGIQSNDLPEPLLLL